MTKTPNAKSTDFEIPAKLPHVSVNDYNKNNDSANGSAEDTRDGTAGFSPNYAGNGIAGINNTSSFDIEDSSPPRKRS